MPDTIQVWFEDDLENRYNLTDAPIDFGEMQRGETKLIKVVLQNTDRVQTGITVKLVAHPTAQVGPAEDTYDKAKISFNEGGPFTTNELSIASMSPNEEREVWIQWGIVDDTLPGDAQFAIESRGTVNI